MKTLKNYFRLSIFAITSILFILFYISSSFIHTNLTIEENQKNSEALSKQIFNSMYQIMRKGWSREELNEFITGTKDSFKNTSHNVEIFRSKEIEELFGTIKQANSDIYVNEVFNSKEKITLSQKHQTKNYIPIIAKKECLSCHTNTKENSVLGVMKIEYDFSDLINEARLNYLILSLILIPFMALISYFISKNLLNKINFSLLNFRNKLDGINSVKDFKNLNIKKEKKSFAEFDSIMEGLNNLSEKLKEIAVDKDMLEFEVKLLDKMIITSDIIRDWKEYINDLLLEINSVLPVHCLITIFKTNEDVYEVEVFWLGKVNNEVTSHINKLSKNMIKEHHNLDVIDCNVNHNISNDKRNLSSLSIDDIAHEAKSILLDAPKIGGIVGLGIQSKLEKDSIQSIVIDSILTTLLNLVGSIKAINKYTENLEFYATRDPLTSLFSQRVFRDLLEYEVKRAKRHKYEFGLLVIDCDNFKPINDKYGHSFGDEFLKAFANILSTSKRDEDILSRYGGDEFTLILPESNQKETYTVAKRILQNVENFELESPDGEQVGVTVSIGIAIFPEHSTTPSDLFNIADSMMYQAKDEGKNSVRFPKEEDIEEIHKEGQDKSMLVLNAIKNENIIPYFQPIMTTSNGNIEINELLMRIEVEDEILPAGKFIETAESLGIVHKMDYLVIEKAFKKIRQVNYEGILFINLSPKALIIGEFIEKIVNLTNIYKINKEKIVFEITERETVKSFSLLEKFVHNLKLEGFNFAIDDFGSGFSTFHYIKRFPIDYIKIDGDFILNIDKDKKDLAFVKSIVSLSKDLGIQTVAEFVENKEILNFLEEIKIDYAQGYYIGKPSKDVSSRIS